MTYHSVSTRVNVNSWGNVFETLPLNFVGAEMLKANLLFSNSMSFWFMTQFSLELDILTTKTQRLLLDILVQCYCFL